MTLASGYRSPGVFTEATRLPIVTNAYLSRPALALVGDTQRSRSASEEIVLTGTTAVQLTYPNVVAGSVVVTGLLNGVVYVEDTGTGGDWDRTVNGDYVLIARDIAGDISDGERVIVTYEYTTSDYYDVKYYEDFGDIIDHYGEMFSEDGTINSELTLGAYFARQNGAQGMYLVAVNVAGTTPTSEEYTAAIVKLESIPDIDVVVALTGDATVRSYLKTHVNETFTEQARRIAIAAADGSSAIVDTAAMQAIGGGINSERVVFVSPSTVEYYNPITQVWMTLGGQYIAAATGGILVGNDIEQALTRKALYGNFRIPDAERRSMSDRRAEAQAGCSLFDVRRNSIVCIHGVTTATSGDVHEVEISVVRSRYYMMTALENMIDESFIGEPIDNDTPIRVKGSVQSILEQLKMSTVIADYRGVVSRQHPTNVTTIEVKFEYKPAYPLNYVQVQFAVNTSTGDIEFS